MTPSACSRPGVYPHELARPRRGVDIIYHPALSKLIGVVPQALNTLDWGHDVEENLFFHGLPLVRITLEGGQEHHWSR